MIGDIMQPTHLLFVLVIALLVLGPKRLPEVGRQLGKGLRDFRAAINGEHTEHEENAGVDQSRLSEAHQTPSEPIADNHQYGQEASGEVAGPEADSTPPGEPSSAGPSGHEAESGSTSGSAGEHEFAYEPARPSDKPADPLA